MVFHKKISEDFPFLSLCKTVDPRGGAIFDPRGIIWTILEKIIRWCYIPNITDLVLMVFHKKISEDFPYLSLCKTVDPRDGAIFDPRGKIWIILVEDH